MMMPHSTRIPITIPTTVWREDELYLSGAGVVLVGVVLVVGGVEVVVGSVEVAAESTHSHPSSPQLPGFQ
jgi:hypothetical protein